MADFAGAAAALVTIAALGHSGDGVAETPAGRVFVPFTLPGEEVAIGAVADGRATLRNVLRPSPDRVEPPCRHFGACGGCALQHMAPAAMLAWKRQQVVAALAQRGIAAEVAAIVPAAPGSRRRVVFTALRTPAGVVLGFSRRASHEVLPIVECTVAAPAIVARLALLRAIAEAALPQRGRASLAVTLADNGLDIAIAEGRLDRRARERLAALAADPAVARLTIAGEIVAQAGVPEIAAGVATLFPPPGGFLQAVASAENALASAVEAAIGDAAQVADLFAGIGTFTVRLARRAQLLSVDGDADALAALERAVRNARGLKAVTVRRRDLFRNPLAGGELDAFGAVVFDPPRAGAQAVAAALAGSKVPRVAAVSCNPATFARDARLLVDGGYRLLWVRPVDQFLFSPHIELVAAFAK